MEAHGERTDADEEVRAEEAAASAAQARARLARERAGDPRADAAEQEAIAAEHDADAVRHNQRARAVRNLTRGGAAARQDGGSEVDELRSVSEMLQRSLLPEALPMMPGLRLAAAFRPADDLVGGDWYDAFRLSGGRLAFALGDVVGHGLEAATAASELRTALRTHALEDPDPAFVAGRLNDLANVRELVSYSSLVYGLVDPAAGCLDLISLGHPPMLLREPDGRVETVVSRHPLLAVLPTGARLVAERYGLRPGAVLLAYTDGLIERRRGNDAERVARLAELMTAEDDPQALVDAALAELASAPADDDIAVLCIAVSEPD